MKCSKLTSDYNDRGLNIYNIICDGFEDQMNCTGSLISPLTCDIKGYPTTLSEYTICSEPPLCDDGIDTVCHEIGLQCHVHKHRVCDGIPQCPGALDEGTERCGFLTPRSITCTRKLAGNKGLKISFPTSWIMDGIEDCEDGLDENGTLWTKKCGTGSTNVYTFNSTSTCDTVPLFRCPGQQSVGVDEADMCTSFQSCDASVCTASRKPYMTNLVSHFNSVRERGRGMFHCVPGMEKIQEFLGPCHLQYHQPEFKTFGVPKPEPILTSKQYAKKLDCEQTFGEMYVTLACNKMCKKSVSCPLTRLTYSSCTNFPDSRVLTITDDYRLTVLLADKDDSYRDNVFGCSNGKCIEFASVCDLKDDCGDGSDENSCSNNFKCTDSGEYIPKSMKCDGKFDCFDLSDECNGDCDNQVQMFKHPSLYFTAWVLGLLSVVLNIAVIYRGCQELYGLKTNIAIINKTFVTFISMGDLLQGIFLLTIAIADDLANKSTCITQFDWTTNDLCSAIGIISTTGGLISLYSMTVLSVIRAYGVGRMSAPKHGIQVKEIVILIAILCVILSVASTIAIAPILPNFEDLFVTQLHYRNNRLFVGAPNKEAHIRILKDYFEGLRVRSMSWSQIRRLVREMFANTEVVGKPVGFYGINGFCLFNYFASPNTSHFWYSGSILGGNLLCVAVITACYSYVNTVTSNSSAIAGSHNQHVQESNKRIQRNISILITTDLISWVPFITACVVHYSGVMETSKWYSIFSVLILPCNSFINPIVILDAEIRAAVGRMLAFVRSVCSGSGQGHRE